MTVIAFGSDPERMNDRSEFTPEEGDPEPTPEYETEDISDFFDSLPPMDEETGYIAHDLIIEQLEDIGHLPPDLYAVADTEPTATAYRIWIDQQPVPAYAVRLGGNMGMAWGSRMGIAWGNDASWATVDDLPVKTCVLMFLDEGDEWEKRN